MKLVYFAWVRERVGRSDEIVTPPADVRTVGDLIGWLQGRGEEYAYAFENGPHIRAAINRRHVRHDAPLGDAQEVAFFPPMTGG